METWPKNPEAGDTSREGARDYIQALLYEREACERRGLPDRVKLINAELRRVGHEAEKPAERAERRPAGSRTTR